MTAQGFTGLLIVFVVAGLVVWDAIAYNVWGYDATVSNVVINVSKNWPILTFAAGVICGHLWFPTLTTAKAFHKEFRESFYDDPMD